VSEPGRAHALGRLGRKRNSGSPHLGLDMLSVAEHGMPCMFLPSSKPRVSRCMLGKACMHQWDRHFPCLT